MRQNVRATTFPLTLIRQRSSLLLLAIWLAFVPPVQVAYAQAENAVTGATVRVANTDGARLNLRVSPSAEASIISQLEPGATLTVTGAAQTAGGMRWLPVRTAAGQTGWVSAQYVQLVSTPTPSSTRTPTPDAAASAGASTASSTGGPPPATPVPGRSLTLDVKVKYPEVQGREQEITVFVTRDGVPVPGVLVTVQSLNGDEDERFVELDPTDDEGRARRSFDIRREKGTVELIVKAIAPDGGEGRTTASYFRR